MNIQYYWGGDRNNRRLYAQSHTKEMEEKWIKEIIQSCEETKEYFPDTVFNKMKELEHIQVFLCPENSVEAIFNHAAGRTAVLNFASYKEPGGKFIDGSRAQEECLCAESYLYNVLKRFQHYYDWNKNKHLDLAMYRNRALYTPNIVFFHDNQSMCCDVITCAAPNITPSRKYGWGITKEKNSEVLDSRIKFVLDVAEDNQVDTLILGAFGCGVFGQDAEEVAKIFIKYLKAHKVFKKIIFAIPQDIHCENYNKFKKVLEES